MAGNGWNPLVGLMDIVADAVDWVHETFSDPALSRELRRDLGIDATGDPQRRLPTGEKIRMRHPNGDPVDVDKEVFDATVAQVRAALVLLLDFFRAPGDTPEKLWDVVGLVLRVGAAQSIRARGDEGHLIYALARAGGFIHGSISGEEVEALDVFRAVDLLGGPSGAPSDRTDPEALEGFLNWVGVAASIVVAADVGADKLPVRLRASYGFERDPDSKTLSVDKLADQALTIDVSDLRPQTAATRKHASLTAVYVGPQTDGVRRLHIAIGGGISYTEGRFTASLEAPAAVNFAWHWPLDLDAGALVSGLASFGRADAKALEFGETDGPHIVVESIALKADLSATSSLRLELKGIDASLALSDGDAFIASLSQNLKTSFDLALVYDKAGLRFERGPTPSAPAATPSPQPLADLPVGPTPGGLRATVPANVTHFGPFRIQSGHIDVGRSLVDDTPRTSIEIATSADLDLGPFTVSIDRIGMRLDLRAGGVEPNLGLLDLDLAFKAPTGVGLAIQTPAVAGGGFLSLDEDAGRYTGAFELTILDTVAVKALAIITTRMADGGDGFTLLVVITAEGFRPIPLGMGFTLTGIGGMIALNRTVDADAVRGGLSDGVLDAVLFPANDPVNTIERRLATLDRIFPPAQDRIVVGPIADISWGSPPLLRMKIALLLELPRPIRAIVLAALSVVLPRERDAVVELHVDAIGVLDQGRGELSLDAALHHSRLLDFNLTGEMALRLNWGSDPIMLLSVGGFHPKFVAPRGMRPLKRLALTLTDANNPRVRFEAYLALTSNTIQLGARVTIYASKGGFGIDGGGSFDALVQLRPFAVQVSFGAWVRIFSPVGTLLAASVAVDVTGPRPWHVTGKVTVSLLFFSVTVGVDFTLGSGAAPEPVETVDVAALLWEQVADRANWQAVLAPARAPGATLAPQTGAARADAPLVAHPLSVISVRQQVVPLATAISRVGAAVPAEGTRSYDLDVTVPTSGLGIAAVDELFAPGQYSRMSDDAQLAQPSFVRMPAGVSVRAAAASAAGPRLACDLAVETLDVTALDDPAAPGARVAAVSA